MLKISGNVGTLIEKLMSCSILTTKCRITLSSNKKGDICTILLLLPYSSSLEEAEDCYSYLEGMRRDLEMTYGVKILKSNHNFLHIELAIEERIGLFETVQILINNGPWKQMVPSLIMSTPLTEHPLIMDFSFFVEEESDILVVDELKLATIKKLKKAGFNFDNIICNRAKDSDEMKLENIFKAKTRLIRMDKSPMSTLLTLLNKWDERKMKTSVLNAKEEWVSTRESDASSTDRYMLAPVNNSLFARIFGQNPLKLLGAKSSLQDTLLYPIKALFPFLIRKKKQNRLMSSKTSLPLLRKSRKNQAQLEEYSSELGLENPTKPLYRRIKPPPQILPTINVDENYSSYPSAGEIVLPASDC